MKDQRQHPDDFAAVSPSKFADAVGLRPIIVRELMERKELQHFIDAFGKPRVWLDISRYCKHPVEPIDWSKAPMHEVEGIDDDECDLKSE